MFNKVDIQSIETVTEPSCIFQQIEFDLKKKKKGCCEKFKKNKRCKKCPANS